MRTVSGPTVHLIVSPRFHSDLRFQLLPTNCQDGNRKRMPSADHISSVEVWVAANKAETRVPCRRNSRQSRFFAAIQACYMFFILGTGNAINNYSWKNKFERRTSQ
jgi:hypothetical protein